MRFDELLAQAYFHSCARCGGGSLSLLCPLCRAQPLCEKWTGAGLQILSLGPYDGAIGDSVRALKYHQETAHAAQLGRALGQLLPRGFTDAILIPVPLHPIRLAERGYNQTSLIARAIAGSSRLTVDLDLLHRIRQGAPQATLGESERKKNLENTFSAKVSSMPRPVVLVDDVATTGSTMDACWDALQHKGHVVVGALSCAISREATPRNSAG